MSVAHRRGGGRYYYERGVAIEFAYPDFDAPQALWRSLRNPIYGDEYERLSLAQTRTETATGRSSMSSTADDPARHLPYSWKAMPYGWPQGQRISSAGVIVAVTTQDVVAGADYLVSVGFRTFDGEPPESLKLQQLNLADSPIVETDFPLSAGALRRYAQGGLRQLDIQATLHASTVKLRILAESAGEDFLISDLHALQADGTDSYSEPDFAFDSDADGLADGWAVLSGSPSLEHYAEDSSGLEEWIRLVSKGGLRTFEVRRPGTGHVLVAKLVSPLQDVGAKTKSATSGSGIRLLLEDAES